MAAAAGQGEEPLSAGEYLEEEKASGPFLYDLVFEKDDPHFSGASKTHRDTQNPTILSKNRYVGTMTTTSMLSHGPPDEFHKPQFARKPIVRDTFYRKTNIFFPESGCAGAGQD
ncbi:hypothetical protein BSKO_03888 [Bryopsis sp. KO-2023]|nr:hypothetical protein BSKO_03888 [Bryopsis sp. KO-2023]